jgi:hypothetical protein
MVDTRLQLSTFADIADRTPPQCDIRRKEFRSTDSKASKARVLKFSSPTRLGGAPTRWSDKTIWIRAAKSGSYC